MLSVLETRYMEQMPRLIRELTDDVAALSKEVARLTEVLNARKEE